MKVELTEKEIKSLGAGRYQDKTSKKFNIALFASFVYFFLIMALTTKFEWMIWLEMLIVFPFYLLYRHIQQTQKAGKDLLKEIKAENEQLPGQSLPEHH